MCAPSRSPLDTAATDALLATGRRLIYTSGLWVLGNTDGLTDETAPADPPAVVAHRPLLERRVLAAGGIVIRPGIVYGHAAGIPAMLVDAGRDTGVVDHPGDGRNHWSTVHVDDLARLYVLAVESAPASTLLNAVAGEPVRLADIAASAARAADIRTELERGSYPGLAQAA